MRQPHCVTLATAGALSSSVLSFLMHRAAVPTASWAPLPSQSGMSQKVSLSHFPCAVIGTLELRLRFLSETECHYVGARLVQSRS